MVSALCKELECSIRTLEAWIDSEPGRRDLFNQAKRASAHCFMDKAREIYEQRANHLSNGDAKMLMARASFYERRAKQAAPEEYGDQQPQTAVQVNVDVGRLHLDALRAHGKMTPELREKWAEKEEVPTVDAEIVDDSASVAKSK